VEVELEAGRSDADEAISQRRSKDLVQDLKRRTIDRTMDSGKLKIQRN